MVLNFGARQPGWTSLGLEATGVCDSASIMVHVVHREAMRNATKVSTPDCLNAP